MTKTCPICNHALHFMVACREVIHPYPSTADACTFPAGRECACIITRPGEYCRSDDY